MLQTNIYTITYVYNSSFFLSVYTKFSIITYFFYISYKSTPYLNTSRSQQWKYESNPTLCDKLSTIFYQV